MASDDELNDDARSNYIEDLTRLNTNSKPMINMLSQVAGTYVNKGGAETIVKLIYERLQQVIMNDDDTTLLYIIGRTIISTDQVHSVRRKINVFSQVEYTRNERETRT